MKWVFILLVSCVIASCMTDVSKSFMDNSNISSDEKLEYVKYIEAAKTIQKQYKRYHILAVCFMAYGGFQLFSNGRSTFKGIASIGTGCVISAWAAYIPNNQDKVGWLLLVIVIGAMLYGAMCIIEKVKDSKDLKPST